MEESLPQDIIDNILIRLPLKSLVRCKYVSKPWYRLISDPRFVKLHLELAKANKQSKIMIQTGATSLSSLDFVDNVVNENWEQDLMVNYYQPFGGKYPYADIAGSCDGLLLMQCNQITFLWNPATREYKKLPKHCFHGDYSVDLGFGYDEISKDYKVVNLVCKSNRHCIHKVHIYSMQNKSWRRIKVRAEYGVMEDFRYPGSGVSLNGILHWKAYKSSSSTIESIGTILSFDLRDEKFQEVSLHGVMTRAWSVVVLKESLCVLEYEPYTTLVESVDVWVMKDYGVNKSWNKLFCIEPPGNDIYRIDMKMLHTSNDGEVLLKSSNRNLVLYNIKGKKSKKLRISNDLMVYRMESYVESLISPKVAYRSNKCCSWLKK